MILVIAQPVSASGTITDPSGDAMFPVHKNQQVPGYLDIVGASMVLDGSGKFIMTLKMAELVPETPALMKSVHAYWWEWAFDTRPDYWHIFPQGYTFEEYAVIVQWDGSNWCADLYDWTSVQEWKDPVLKISLVLNGVGTEELMVAVDSVLMGDPVEFKWAAGTLGWLSPGGAAIPSWAWWHFDGAGIDVNTGEWTTWPD